MVIIAILVGSGTGWGVSLAAAAYALLVLFLVGTILGKHIFFHQKYSSLLMVIVMIALADSFGFLGVVLAPMLAVAIQILVNNLLPIQVAEPRLAEPKVADLTVAEPKMADPKMAELKIVELKITEPNMAEQNGNHDRTGLQSKLDAIKQMITSLDGPRASEITSLTTRLEQLLERSLPVEQEAENQAETSASSQLII